MSSLWKRCAGTALAVAVGVSVASAVAGAQTAPLTLNVDLTDAPRKILHATEVMPVTAAGPPVGLPKCVPGPRGAGAPGANTAGDFFIPKSQPAGKDERTRGRVGVPLIVHHG